VGEGTPDTDRPFGVRLRRLRERRGMTRAVFGGLVGKSEEWVKAVEHGRMLMPRLPMLLRIADVLDLDDLAALTGRRKLPIAAFTGASHEAAPVVADAVSQPVFTPAADRQVQPAALAARVDQAWGLYTRSRTERSAIAPILPGLLLDLRTAARVLDGVGRRRVLADLARAYNLAQCFFAFTPMTEMVWLTADRAMTTAQDADDPLAIAAAAMMYAEVYRWAGQVERATALVLDAAALLDPGAGVEQRARWGALHLSAALSESKAGRASAAWRHWDRASQAADALGSHYTHPWLFVFGRPAVDGYVIRIEANLFRSAAALRHANLLDLSAIPGGTWRASRMLDIAEAQMQRRDYAGAVHMLGKAHRESADLVKYEPFPRQALLDLSERRSSVVRDDACELAAAIGLYG